MRYAGLLEESAITRYLRERTVEAGMVCRTLEKTDPHLLDRLNRAFSHSQLSMSFDDAVCVLTDYRKSGRTVTVECMRISGEGIERGITATARLKEMPENIRKPLELPKGELWTDNSWKPKSSVVSHLSCLESSYRNFMELYDKARERVEKGRQLEMKLQA